MRFFPANAGGQRVRCDIFAPNTRGRRFFCPFFGNVFGSSVPFLIFFEGWASEKEASRSNKSRGTWRRRSRRRSRSRGTRRRRKKKKKKK